MRFVKTQIIYKIGKKITLDRYLKNGFHQRQHPSIFKALILLLETFINKSNNTNILKNFTSQRTQ